MKTTLSWLKSHGHDVDGIEDRAAALDGFVVGRVVSAEPHPNADRLRVCVVDNGTSETQVVCGAPNARTGMKGVFGPAGVRIPKTGMVLAESAIRGVASKGMLMSAAELALGEDHSGIIELPSDAPVGTSYAALLGLDDPVIDLKVTPNRADCLGVRGIARDLAASGIGRLKPLDTTPVEGRFRSPIAIHIEDRKACPLFLGRHIRGLKNGPSPRWLRDRLEAIGLRPISALVDITNFVTFDINRPLHVFDAAKLAGDLTVRFARPGEKLLALNGREYELDPEITAIADPAGVQSLGGVIGGEATGCTEATTEVFVEAALFDPIRTAATGRRLEIVSDARYRFERGIDPAFVGPGLEVATRLILELCGGEASEVVVAGAEPQWRRDYRLRPERMSGLGGLHVPPAESRTVEAVTFSFISAATAELFGGAKPELRLVNPISADLDAMRPSVLPGLVEAARRNADRGFPDVALFELGPLYRSDQPDGQADVAAGLRAGRLGPRDWREPPREADLFDAKADALAALAAAGAAVDNIQSAADPPPWYHPGRAGRLRLGPLELGHFGELHPDVLETLDAKGPIAAFEVFLDAVPLPRAGRARPPLRLTVLQPVERDFAFIVDRDLPAETLLRAARAVDRQLVTKIRLFDVYEGAGLPEGKKSHAISVTLQPQEATLTDAEIEAFSKRLVTAVEKATAGTLRG